MTSTIADTAKIATKQSAVRPSASGDTMKRYFVMVVPMSAAVANESPCDTAIPSTRPTASDASPTRTVSNSKTRLTRPALMPSSR